MAPVPPLTAIPLAEPPVFVEPSTSGQVPWHLPSGTATPSGLAADGIRLGDLEVRAASMVGAQHRCEEPALPRQDAYALGRTTDGQYLVIAVADGVGNSKHADLAARVAVSAATRELARTVETGGIPAIDAGLLYTKIAGEMVGTGRDRGIRDADVCAILITAVIPTGALANGTRPMWASWIGDVSLWIGRGGQLHRQTGERKTGLDPNALAAVLPFNPDQVDERVVELGPYDRVALMTDGVSDSLDLVPGTLEYFARQWSGPPPHPAAFLHSLCYDGPGQTDDRTAVVVWCGAGGRGNRHLPGERR
ncbi:MAG: protein phosphatase 2C domain-containing protein [Trebonia sp.]